MNATSSPTPATSETANPSKTAKLVVVAGANGRLGRLIIDALVREPEVRVRALVREPSKPETAALAGERVELVGFDASAASEAERAAAVAGAYAVVSALQGGPDIIVDAQLALVRAAKAAGARRFIPSDFSYDLFSLPEGVNINSDWRRSLATLARPEADDRFEIVHVLQGIFADAFVLGFLGLFDGQARVVRYWGDGKTPIDWTTWEDTARFTAAAAIDERPVPEKLYVRGDRLDVFGFASAWEAAHGQTLTLERLGSLAELEAETQRVLSTQPENMYGWLPLMYARGVFGGRALLGEIENDRYPGIAAETVAQACARGAL